MISLNIAASSFDVYRTENWHAVSQWVDLETNSAYYFSVWVKLLDQLPGYMWHAVQLLVAIDYVDDRKSIYFVYYMDGNTVYVPVT